MLAWTGHVTCLDAEWSSLCLQSLWVLINREENEERQTDGGDQNRDEDWPFLVDTVIHPQAQYSSHRQIDKAQWKQPAPSEFKNLVRAYSV